MTAQILNGREVSELLLDSLKTRVEQYREHLTEPKLAIILVGDNPASASYVKQKEKACQKVGLLYEQINYPVNVTQEELLAKIKELNHDMNTHGILVQLPLPEHIEVPQILKAINPRKDVDGFHAYNVGKMFLSKDFESLSPCTPKGVLKLLDHYQIDVKGKNVVVVGHSNIVGKPMAVMLLNRDATVTVCHKETADLAYHTSTADILIVAVGKPNLITDDMVKPGVVVVDVGTTKVGDKLCGDVDFDNVSQIASFISPVPGGVGPMTVACLIENTVIAYEWLAAHNFETDTSSY